MKILNKKKLRRQFMGLGKNAYSLVENELSVLLQLVIYNFYFQEHPLTLALHEIIDDPEWDKIYIVTEYLTGGTLEDKVKRGLKPREEWKHFREIIIALEYSN
jgi:serine/threonine protein kinase